VEWAASLHLRLLPQARVIAHYGRNAQEANAVVDQICADRGRADAIPADSAKSDGPHDLAARS
jgi:hypothetical protein